ncbi:hypothetical protein DL770_005976 [Monosporascus sp. CRB-9-2]|nr:hypothetical protein DL770_005976 [Monosporascus sp. CRB-9-2]
MLSFKGLQYTTFFSLLGLLSLIVISFYIAKDGDRPTEAPNELSQLHTRQSVTNAEDITVDSPAAGNASFSLVEAPMGLARRLADDPYTCGPGRPCSNGACCGPSGNCGYAPAYCGTGCLSNCDAKAPCGQYAANPGQTCQLNACCSEHGFCGTTEEFCKPGCQSNCILEPQPPGGSPKNASLDKVIGYYETWSYRSKCNQKSPSDLPLKELTHLNYAFAFIKPGTFELTTMDSETTEDLWQLTVDTKKYNPNLKVYVAVGGWTFSDNDTVTQPLFSEISSTEANRQKFADGVVKFLNKYGFDGLDIDWEYPGAPDRGGKEEDTENFTLLMKTLRSTFNSSPRRLGLTFTIPSSFWYLRWFDMPGLLKYADWTNLMSYDLHGTWDRNNPIGAIAQAHTNLTEINLATQLLWRVGVKPEQVVLGYGFYGRSFELADPSCTTPGCPFSGGARAGPCSDTSGILMYYEIQALLKQVPNLKPILDKEAAVKYVVFDKNQWISYDDADTFKLKMAWANNIGFGGSMIWAVDTDDDKFSAMSGLMGFQVSHVKTSSGSTEALAMTSGNVGKSLQGENGQECRALLDAACKPVGDLMCFSGEIMVGYDRDGCPEDEGKPICCPADTAPKKCVWRGSGNDGGIWGDCNGQCHAGEARVLSSRWGGGPEKDRESDPYNCARGSKVFCCEAGDWKTVIDGCYWTPCFGGGDCKPGTKEMQTKKGNCPMNGVNRDRKKSMCCQVSKAIPPPLYCETNTCKLNPLACNQDGKDDWGNLYLKTRSLSSADGNDSFSLLDKRGSERPFNWKTTFGFILVQHSLSYPTPQRYLRHLQEDLQGIARRWWLMRSRSCSNPVVSGEDLEADEAPPEGGQVEHTVPAVVISRFSSVVNHGRQWSPRPAGYTRSDGREVGQITPRGPRTNTPAITDRNFWESIWNDEFGLPANLPPVTPNSPDIRRPVGRLYEAIGSNSNPSHFTLLQDVINLMKGRLETFNSPMAPRTLRRHVQDALDPTEAEPTISIMSFMAPLREVRGVFEYLNDDDVVTRMDRVTASIFSQLQIIELNVAEARGLSAHWNEFYPYYFSAVSEFARTWAANQIRYIRGRYQANSRAHRREDVLKELQEIEDDIPNWKYAFE